MSTPIPSAQPAGTLAPAPAPTPTPTPTLTALLALAQWQAATPWQGLLCAGDAELAPDVAMFSGALWPALRQRLLEQALAQPTVALRAGPLGASGVWAGPLTHDLVLILRGDGGSTDEAEELDLVVRWWQVARRAGAPVDEDFGEVWRAFEWMAVLLALRQLQALLAPAGAAHDPTRAARATATAAGVSRMALRYGPLKPLLRLLEPLGAAAPGAGYTF